MNGMTIAGRILLVGTISAAVFGNDNVSIDPDVELLLTPVVNLGAGE